MAATVPVNLLTGFLGVGKTTLLRHVLEHGLTGRRVAVVVNEIGIESFLFESPHPFHGDERLHRALTALPHDVYRVKGIALVEGRARPHLVNATCGRVNLDVAPAALAKMPSTSLVVIGRGVASDHRQTIERRIAGATRLPTMGMSHLHGLARIFPGERR